LEDWRYQYQDVASELNTKTEQKNWRNANLKSFTQEQTLIAYVFTEKRKVQD